MKPCPFCGTNDSKMIAVAIYGTKRFETSTTNPNNPWDTWESHCECRNCGTAGPTHYDQDSEASAREGALYLWNDRTPKNQSQA